MKFRKAFREEWGHLFTHLLLWCEILFWHLRFAMPCDDVVIVESFSSPFCVVFLPPEGVVGLVHEHAVLKEHDI